MPPVTVHDHALFSSVGQAVFFCVPFSIKHAFDKPVHGKFPDLHQAGDLYH